MSDTANGGLPADFADLVDLYCSDLIDDAGFHRLEALLLDDDGARRYFVDYFQHHTDVQFAVRAGRAANAVLDQIATPLTSGIETVRGGSDLNRRGNTARWLGIAAAVLGFVSVSALWRLGVGVRAPAFVQSPGVQSPANIAWLVNAQDCIWAGHDQQPGRDMRPGKVLHLERGLAEIEFDQGTRVILQGPAGLEFISASSMKLNFGTLTARVPRRARGFSVLTSGGKVVDLGTEFGLSVDKAGTTTVRVFKGEIAAFPSGADPTRPDGVKVHQNQTAQIDGRTVALGMSKWDPDDPHYVRSIVPPPLRVPRKLQLDFARQQPETLLDSVGQGTGLTHRLPGTGAGLPERDPNLRIRPERHALELTTTRSDLNTQERLPTGEYLGVRLTDMGFTGPEDFEISATIPDIPGLNEVGQFGLYAGPRSDTNIRGGLIRRGAVDGSPVPRAFRVFLVNNLKGIDTDIYEVGLMTTGDDLRLILRRQNGRYSLVVDNLTRNSSSTLEIAHPAFLDQEKDLYVGLFGANTQSDLRKTLTIRELSVTVWTTQPDNQTIIQRTSKR